jgi:hypothetical protein
VRPRTDPSAELGAGPACASRFSVSHKNSVRRAPTRFERRLLFAHHEESGSCAPERRTRTAIDGVGDRFDHPDVRDESEPPVDKAPPRGLAWKGHVLPGCADHLVNRIQGAA